MPYPRNKYKWPVGSLVLHAHDAKRIPYMMMKVIGYTSEDIAITRYINPQTRYSTDKPLNNGIEYLLDPAAFGYFVPQNYDDEELYHLVIFMNRWSNVLGDGPEFFYLLGLMEAVCYFREYKRNDMLESLPNVAKLFEQFSNDEPLQMQDYGALEGLHYLTDMWTEERIVEYGKDFRW